MGARRRVAERHNPCVMSRRALAYRLVLLVLPALAACATRSGNVEPLPTDSSTFATMNCDAMVDEIDRVRVRATEVAYTLDERSGANIVALGLGVTVFWPALLAMRPVGADAEALAQLKGRDEALQRALAARQCPPAPEVLAPERAAVLPIALGARLVYEERAAAGGAARELGLRVAVLRRGEIEFVADERGRAQREPWVQDAFGNQRPTQSGIDWLTWRRLLRPDMKLGDVLAGDFVGAGPATAATPHGRVRGQVVAQGVQHSLGRPFDAAVIELYGDVSDGDRSTRLDGAMVVDRKSGVLLRLELRSGNPEFAFRRTLVRIEPVTGQ